jgi:hypothetical protein
VNNREQEGYICPFSYIFLIILILTNNNMSVQPPATVAAGAVTDHPDAAYIKQDDLGLVIAKGLAFMYQAQPANPVDFLAKWLLNYASVQ